MFDNPSGAPDRLDDERATVRAAELTERIVDELIRQDHDWRTILALAQELAELSEAMTRCR